MITHTVLFRLKRPASDDDRRRFIRALRDFAADPPYASGPAEVADSLGLRGDSPRTADALLRVQFPDGDVFPAYIEHERHRALVSDVLEPSCEGWWSVQADG